MANTRKVYVRNGCQDVSAGSFNDTQSIPSVNCCIENKIGMVPNARWGLFVALATDTIPIAPSTALAPKLAVAEKHIALVIVEGLKIRDNTLCPQVKRAVKELAYFRIKYLTMSSSSRRRFVVNTSAAAIAGTFIFADSTKQRKEMKNVFVHHVYFWLKNTGNEEDLGKLVAGLKKLSAVKTIRQFHIGKPASTSREVIDGSYAVSWLVLFDNKADQDSYQTDPVHLEFIANCSMLWQKVVVYDSVDMQTPGE